MKYFVFIAIAGVSLASFSCGNSTGATATAAAAGSAPATASDDGNFSCTLNGTAINGKGTDGMQLRNTAFLYPDKDNGDHILTELCDSKSSDDNNAAYFIKIRIPAQPGTYTVKVADEYDAKTMPVFVLSFLKGDYSEYVIRKGANTKDWATVTIISNDGKRVKGTFTAGLTLSGDTPKGTVQKVDITDGKFDVPYSTSKIRPE